MADILKPGITFEEFLRIRAERNIRKDGIKRDEVTMYQSGGAHQSSRKWITAAATHPKRTWPTSATHVNSVKPKKAGNPATR